MSWMNFKRPEFILATFVFVVLVAIASILYFTRPIEMSSDAMDKQLLDSIKKTVSPFDIKNFIETQKIENSIVNLHLFTVCNETKRCSVYAFIGFAEAGDGKEESTLFVEVETQADENRTLNQGGNCEPLWRFKKSNWAVKILNGGGQGETLLAHGEFNDISRMSTFDGRSSAINILHSMQRAIVTRISEERSTKNAPGVQCRVENTPLWETKKPDVNCPEPIDWVTCQPV
ncbi:hypothetical protein SAMN05216204_12150 [Massilia yuzhufengensis]|jgi:hypothetical protein|uniref:Uncharacterized protein n=2 Tax=Massilia yuzhufengensis TaxID=1164594 RepID=A0A1I1REG0_9BURK|nr:hypothetical protein SAMN05216204_12150 [Massilia yuzhufengensis]